MKAGAANVCSHGASLSGVFTYTGAYLPEIALQLLPASTHSLGHAGSLLFYDFGLYDPPFLRYCPKMTQVRVARQTGNSLEVISGLYRLLGSYWFIVII